MPEEKKVDKLLVEIWRRVMEGRAHQPYGSSEMIAPAAPSIFQPEPLAVGNPEFAREVRKVSNDFPGVLRKGVPRVIQGPTAGTMELMMTDGAKAGLKIDEFAGTNLLGATDTKTNEIGINPSVEGDDLRSILAHEFSHAVGAGDNAAYPIGEQYAEERAARPSLESIMAARKRKKIIGK